MIKTSTLTSIILLSLCFITSGCHNTNDKNKRREGIQFKLSLEQDITFLPADSIFGEKWIVPLETTDENIISQIDKLEIYNDRFYILDNTQDIIFILINPAGILLRLPISDGDPTNIYASPISISTIV